MATGDSYRTIAFSFRVGRSTVSGIVSEVCALLWKYLQPIYMPFPDKEMWTKSAETFKSAWNFPNCVASIDGKHVTIQCSKNSGSNYWCYKQKFSVVLLAIVDANYQFIAIDVGACGKDSDAGIFERSSMGQRLENKTFNLPEDTPIMTGGSAVPYVIVGDQGFSLKTYLMRPFPESKAKYDERFTNFNKRLSRARRVAENAFGILSKKWRVFQRPMQLEPENVVKVVKAACCLHNFLRQKKVNMEHLDELTDDVIRNEIASMLPLEINARRSNNAAFKVREEFVSYFSSEEGRLSWDP